MISVVTATGLVNSAIKAEEARLQSAKEDDFDEMPVSAFKTFGVAI